MGHGDVSYVVQHRGWSEKGTKIVVRKNRPACPESAPLMQTSLILLLNEKRYFFEVSQQACRLFVLSALHTASNQ